jgi:hypothetical protein
MGCYANNPDDYETFKPFFKKALEVYHKVDLSKQKHVNDWNFAGVAGLPSSGVLDLSKLGLPPLSMRVRTGRNLNRFPLPASMTKEDRINLELEMGKVFDQLIADPSFGGRYVSITPGHKNYIDPKEYQQLVDANIMFKDMSADPYLNAAGAPPVPSPLISGCFSMRIHSFFANDWLTVEPKSLLLPPSRSGLKTDRFAGVGIAHRAAPLMLAAVAYYSPTLIIQTGKERAAANRPPETTASLHRPLPPLRLSPGRRASRDQLRLALWPWLLHERGQGLQHLGRRRGPPSHHVHAEGRPPQQGAQGARGQEGDARAPAPVG